MPVKLITHPQPGLFGAAAAFAREHAMTIDAIMRTAPVIPVLVLDGDGDGRRWPRPSSSGPAGARGDIAHAGTRSTRSAQMRKVPGAIVGAGTVLNERAAGPGDRSRQPIHRLAGADRAARASRSRDTASPTCPASPPPATSCAGSISGSTGSNSFRPKRRAGCGAEGAVRRRSAMPASARPAGSGRTTPPEWLALDAVLCVGGSWLYRGPGTASSEVSSAPAPPRPSRSLNFALTMFP